MTLVCDFQAGRIYIPESKNKEARTFPFTDDLRAILERRKVYTKECELRQEGGKKILYVFHRDGERVVNCERSWKTACKNAGMDGGLMHDFRRTAIRSFNRLGIPDKVAMTMTGHKTRSVYDRYNIVNEQDLYRAAEILNAASRAATVEVTVEVSENRANPELPKVVNS